MTRIFGTTVFFILEDSIIIRTNYFFDCRSLRLTRDAQGMGPREQNSHPDRNRRGIPGGIDFSTFGNVADPDVWTRGRPTPGIYCLLTEPKLLPRLCARTW